MKILLMEDNADISTFIKFGLEKNDCTVDIVYDSSMAEKLVFQKKYDIIILDVIVPGKNGFEVCKIIRSNNIKTPVIMLTSLDATADKVTGFDCGADDYLIKPFEFAELMARIKSLYRRSNDTLATPSLIISDLEINTITKKVYRDNKEIKLTTREYKILELLASNKGKVFERIEIIEKIWGTTFNSGTNVIDVHINSLRNKIDKNSPKKLIHTIIRMGYSLNDNPEF